MATITVSGIITREEHILLVRPAGAEHWLLPHGHLADDDDSVEAALERSLRELLAVEILAHEFVDTLYERLPEGVTVHNIFIVTDLAGTLPPDRTAAALELRWIALDDVHEFTLPSWLAEALPSLLTGEQAITGFDLERLAGVTSGTAAAPVLIINGPAGAGKSTVSRAICARLTRAAHVEVDRLRHMVVSGFASPVPGQSDPTEARHQLDLGHANAAALARNFAESGFTAVIDTVMEEPEELDILLAGLAGLEVSLFTLLPNAGALRERDQSRPAPFVVGERAEQLRRIIAANGDVRGLRLDTSDLDIETTVNSILEQAHLAVVRDGMTGQN